VGGNAHISRWLQRDSTRWSYALYGFEILGTNAETALPELVRRFNTSKNENFINSTAAIIGRLGKPALNFLTPILQNKADQRRIVALQTIGGMKRSLGADAESAVPILLSVMNDSSDPLAHQAAAELGTLGAVPERVVPLLTNALQSTNVAMRVGAIVGLMGFRTNVSIAIPAIKAATHDSDANVSSLASKALSVIAPYALTNGPPTNK
jgi:HEAT repeat protein